MSLDPIRRFLAPGTPAIPVRAVLTRLASACTTLTIAACSLLPPPDVHTTYALPTFNPPTPSAVSSAWVLRVDTPRSTAPLDTRQVIVQYPNASLASWRGILWADRTPVLLREHLAQTLGDSGLYRAVLAGNTTAPADAQLVTTLRRFQFVHANAHTDAHIEVRLQAQLIHNASVLGQKLFTHTQTVKGVHNPDAVIGAFGRATDALAADMLAWLQGLSHARATGATP